MKMVEKEDKYREPEGMAAHNDDEVDLIELALKLWRERRLIWKWCGIAAVVALVLGFTLPKEYTASAMLAPESSSTQNISGGIGALAGMMGLNLGNTSRDAVSPTLYPDVVTSVPFVTGLFPLEVHSRKGELETTLYDYIENHTHRSWIGAVLTSPFRLLGWFVSLFSDRPDSDNTIVDPHRLTRDQMHVFKDLNERISVLVDKKTSVITLSVMMQDPVIAAEVTEAVMENLTAFIIDYRTSKARRDLEFTQKLFDETRQSYEEAQARYADYVDRNHNLVLQRVRIEQDRLQNEMNLAYNVYNQTAQQLQLAKAKVQESTPIYAVVQPVTIPLRASKPSKMMMLVGFVFLAFAAVSAWILFGRDLFARLKGEEDAEPSSDRKNWFKKLLGR